MPAVAVVAAVCCAAAGAAAALSGTAGVPVLVSEPEPAWLNADTKQR